MRRVTSMRRVARVLSTTQRIFTDTARPTRSVAQSLSFVVNNPPQQRLPKRPAFGTLGKKI